MPSDRVRSGWIGGSVSTETKTPVSEAAIASLDPDQYKGTLGLLADAPKGALKPHYTKFPASDSGGWVWVKSETKVDGIDVLIDQNWLCIVDGTSESTPKNWVLTQRGAKVAQYATHVSCIGTLKRFTPKNPTQIPTDEPTFIPFNSPIATGVFEDLVAKDSNIKLFGTDLYSLPVNNVDFDFTLTVQMSFDVSGDRSLELATYAYYPYDEEGNYDKWALLLERHVIESKTQAAARTRPTDILLHRVRRINVLTEPIDDAPITESVAGYVTQNSGGPLRLIFAELTIVAWK